jgi:hypothetical protein
MIADHSRKFVGRRLIAHGDQLRPESADLFRKNRDVAARAKRDDIKLTLKMLDYPKCVDAD